MKLTPRELDVLRLVSYGYSYKKVAIKLFVSKETVKTHMQNIFRKLNSHSAVGAVATAIRKGIIE